MRAILLALVATVLLPRPPIVVNIQRVAFTTTEAHGVTLNMPVKCGTKGCRIHLYIGSVVDDWALGSPVLLVDGFPQQVFLPVAYCPTGAGMHEFISVVYGSGELKVIPDVWGRSGVPYYFRLDEDQNF